VNSDVDHTSKNRFVPDLSLWTAMQKIQGQKDKERDRAHCTLWGKNGPKRLKTENRENGQFWMFQWFFMKV